MRAVTGSVALLLFSLFTLATAPPAWALIVAQPTGPVKVALADVIVVGKVMTTTEKIETTATSAAKKKVPHAIAVIEVTEVFKGDVTNNKVRVGYPLIGPGVKLAAGQAGLFFLRKHHMGDFYVVPAMGMFVGSQNKANFDRELDDVRKTLPVLANPLASLKTADAAKGLEVAAILIPVYRTAPPDTMFQQVDVNAEESKLLLKALLDADWDHNKYKDANFRQIPAKLFNMLGLGPKNGFQDPMKGLLTPEYVNAARAWLTKNWQTHRLQKVVVTTAAADK